MSIEVGTDRDYVPLRCGGYVARLTLYSDGEQGEPYVFTAAPEDEQARQDLLALALMVKRAVFERVCPQDHEMDLTYSVRRLLQLFELLPVLAVADPAGFVAKWLDAMGELSRIAGPFLNSSP